MNDPDTLNIKKLKEQKKCRTKNSSNPPTSCNNPSKKPASPGRKSAWRFIAYSRHDLSTAEPFVF